MTDYTVSSGVTTGGYTLSSGDNLYVSSGGVVSSVIILNDGHEYVSAGGLDSGGVDNGADTGAMISQGGEQDVYGSAISATVFSGGVQLIQAGGVATDTTVLSSGSVLVDSQGQLDGAMISGSAAVNGQASGASIFSGGQETVGSGGTTTATTVLNGGLDIVLSGAVATGAVVQPGGVQEVWGSAVSALVTGVVSHGGVYGTRGDQEIESGGVAISTTVSSGGFDTVNFGGVASDTTVGQYGAQYLNSGGSSYDTVVSHGGVEQVVSGASASGTVLSGGEQTVGGTAYGTVIDSGGYQGLYGTGSGTIINSGGEQGVGGVAVDTVVNSGGRQIDFGSTSNTSVNDGGAELVYGGVASGTMVSNGGTLDVGILGGGGSGTGTVVLTGGTELVRSGAVESGAVVSGGLLEVKDGATGAAGSVTFVGAGGTLQIDSHPTGGGSLLPDAVISGFAPGDTINLETVAFHSHGTVSLGMGNVLDVQEGGHTYTLQLDPTQNFSGESFHLTDPAGTNITLTDNPTCYTPDVLILTDAGEVRAGDLQIGDRVVVLSGETKPIRWIGRRSYAVRFVNGDRKILPVSIKAGALGEGLPKRDLQVSPLHALYLDGVLVAARDLVNGVSVVQAEEMEEVHYLHIELDAHEVIFAEGAPAESFRDADCRGMFQNSAEHAALYPEGKPEMAAFAPLVNGGEALQAIRAKIDARAGLQVDAGPLKGFVGSIAGNRIVGWACNPDQPQLPVRLDICVDGRLVAQALANRYRGDLDEAGVGTGRHGFEVTLDHPLPADRSRITVRRSADAKPLPLSHALARAAA